MMNFALIGAAGYIAPRHMKAIRETGNELVAFLDPNDSVGIMDNFFPDADYFREPERFDRHIDKLRRQGDHRIDYVSICSPNYLHDAHIRLSLRNQAHVICEKPLVLNPWNVEALKEIELETGRKINVIFQVRLHPAILELKRAVQAGPPDRIHDVDLIYITSRGKWYFRSWKGDITKSGGVATNIGIHFFDMLIDIFGSVKSNTVHYSDEKTVSGFLTLEKARVRWFLSLDRNLLSEEAYAKGVRTFRSITVNGKAVEFSEGFTDLHTESYRQVLMGNGFGCEDALPSIQTVYEIRNAKPVAPTGDYHPYLKKVAR
ncbi:MAG: Gfo/Idh/MocA family oxidoreductase [Lentimicrobiaceae bacterium]|nr:Gfo/Idh/MocA family oxidoreductase [Lentimicrobiaceae bacterium]